MIQAIKTGLNKTMSRLTRTSLMLAAFFAVDKVLAVIRQILIARQFGLSSTLDVFNVANNLPDLLFALISGGAIAVAFIPVLSESLTLEGRKAAWTLFSRIANQALFVTFLLAVLTAIFAESLVGWELGIAPGFNNSQQDLVVELMRLNLIATIIFSFSGLVMAALQANQHFLLPALAPIFYNFGQIIGALVFAPETGLVIGGVRLPAFGLGIYGLVYGVIFGACLHLAIQIPGLIKYKFTWSPGFGLNDRYVHKVLKLLGPRLLTILIIQMIFIIRDNLASRLAEGAVSSLAYGWMIQQVPETIIGTAIGTALLPTLSEFVTKKDRENLKNTVERAMRVLIGLTVPIAVLLMIGLRPFLATAFNFGESGTDLLLWVTRAYLVGLTGHCMLELAARVFYAEQDAIPPLIGALLNLTLYILVGSQLYKYLGAAGISLTDSIAFTSQAIFLIFLLDRRWRITLNLRSTIIRTTFAAIIGTIITFIIFSYSGSDTYYPLVFGTIGMMIGGAVMLPFIWPEVKIILKL